MTNVNVTAQHKRRVRDELINAGVSRYGLLKLESRYLPRIIHPNEHIEAVAYGITPKNFSAMLVATDRRIIYLDKKPGYTISDEIRYEMVAGVGYNVFRNRAAVVLHTRLGDYPLRFVSVKAAEKFVHYIEIRRVEVTTEEETMGHYPANITPAVAPDITPPAQSTSTVNKKLTPEGIEFLKSHQTAVFSTVDRDGNVAGAVVYYFVDENNQIYILTKAETHKTHNVLANHRIALTIYSSRKLQTLQIQGQAEIESDVTKKQKVYSELSKVKVINGSQHLPPVANLDAGAFIVIRIKPLNSTFRDFKKIKA